MSGACDIAWVAQPGQVDPLWNMLTHGAGPSPSSTRLLGLPVNMGAEFQEGGEAWAWQSHASPTSYWPKYVLMHFYLWFTKTLVSLFFTFKMKF